MDGQRKIEEKKKFENLTRLEKSILEKTKELEELEKKIKELGLDI